MGSERSAGQAVKEQATTLTQVLSGLKRRGSVLLLAGPAQHGAISTACRRLLGTPPDTRRRLFVSTGDAHADDHGIESLTGPEFDAARAICYETKTRSAAATAPGGACEAAPGPSIDSRVASRTVGGSLGGLLEAIVEDVEALDDQADGLEPAELRVCLDSVDALLATHDEEAVFRFLHLLSGVARRYRAMCHVHLPADVDTRAVALLEPTADAVVEVRNAGSHQQRWHVPDAELTTDWLLL